MRKSSIITLALLALVACESYPVESDSDNDKDNMVVFTAIQEDCLSTRTSLQSGNTIYWDPAEEINLFYGGIGSSKFISTNTEAALSATFQGHINGELNEWNSFWAVYPYRDTHTCSGSDVIVTLPSEQMAVPGSFSKDLFIAVAHSDDHDLRFFNVCGGVKFSVTEENVHSVVFRGNNYETIAGQAKVFMDEDDKPAVSWYLGDHIHEITVIAPDGGVFVPGVSYYLVAYPTTFNEGYSLSLHKTDGTVAVKKYEKPVTIKRSVFGVLNQVDSSIEYGVPNNEIWYTSIDGQLIYPESTGAILSNEYIDGKGRIVFDKDVVTVGLNAFYNSALLSVILPPSVEEIGTNAFLDCSSLSSVPLPRSVKSIGDSAFAGCSSLTSITLPEGLLSIGGGAFKHTGLTSVSFPDSLVDIGGEAFLDTNLEEVHIVRGIQSIGSLAFASCEKLKSIYFEAQEPPYPSGGLLFLQDAWRTNLLIYVPESCARNYMEAEDWFSLRGFVTEEGHQPDEFFYVSTDYSADGEVVQLQEATEGSGIGIVFLGDGFVDKDLVSGGAYESRCRLEMEDLFSCEPFNGLRNRINVYMVKNVSKHDVYASPYAERKFTEDTGWNTMLIDFSSALGCVEGMDVYGDMPLFTAILRNKENSCEGEYSFPDISLCVCSDRRNTGDRFVIAHELGGHLIGALYDEYLNLVGSGFPESDRAWLDESHAAGLYLNWDWRNSPDEVSWSRFLQDERYANEGLGIFEGGSPYLTGIYHPSEESIMNSNNTPSGWFNAPSRAAIYWRVMSMTEGEGWTFDYDTFVQFDAVGREDAAKQYADWKAKNVSSVR